MNQFKILLTLLCTISLVKGITGDPLQSAVAELTSQITVTHAKIDDIILNSANLLRQTRRIISQTIKEAKTSLPQSPQDSLTFSDSDLQKLDDCSNNRDLDLLNLEFTFLRITKNRLSNVIPYCLYQGGKDVDAVSSCGKKEIATYAGKLEDIRNRFNVVCEEATKRATACTEGIVKGLDKILAMPRF